LSVTPSYGTGGTAINITGTNFVPIGITPFEQDHVSIGTIWCVFVVWVNSTFVTAVVSSGGEYFEPLSVVVGGQASNSVNFFFGLLPTLLSVSPLVCPTAGCIIELGGYFGASPQVDIGALGCGLLEYNATYIRCYVSSYAGTNYPVVVTSDGVASNAILLSYERMFLPQSYLFFTMLTIF